jgi:hypothetical protein
VLLGPRPGHPPVGEQLIESRHHLLLGHHWQFGQLTELEARRVDPGKPPGVEG